MRKTASSNSNAMQPASAGLECAGLCTVADLLSRVAITQQWLTRRAEKTEEGRRGEKAGERRGCKFLRGKGGNGGKGTKRRDDSRKETPKVGVICMWVAGRIKWRVLGLIIKKPEIELFVCDPENFSLSLKGQKGVGWEGRKTGAGGGEEGEGGGAGGRLPSQACPNGLPGFLHLRILCQLRRERGERGGQDRVWGPERGPGESRKKAGPKGRKERGPKQAPKTGAVLHFLSSVDPLADGTTSLRVWRSALLRKVQDLAHPGRTQNILHLQLPDPELWKRKDAENNVAGTRRRSLAEACSTGQPDFQTWRAAGDGMTARPPAWLFQS